MRTVSIGLMLLFVLSQYAFAETPKKPTDAEVRNLDRRTPGSKTYDAVVSRVEFAAQNSARVTFSQLRLRDSEGKAKPVGGSVIWEYHDLGPVPAEDKMQVSLEVDKQGKVSAVSAEVQVIAYRKDSANKLEIIAKPAGVSCIYVRPDWIGALGSPFAEGQLSSVTLVWSRTYGALTTVFAAGPGAIETESAMQRAKGIPVGNDPKLKFTPGRDGWELIRTSEEDGGAKIPEKQHIWAAG